MIPARSAPDLQCIRQGYSTVSNTRMACSTWARVGASREAMTRSTSLIPSRSQASTSSTWWALCGSSRRLITVRTPRRAHRFSWNGQGWLVRTRSVPIQCAFWKPSLSQAWSSHRKLR